MIGSWENVLKLSTGVIISTHETSAGLCEPVQAWLGETLLPPLSVYLRDTENSYVTVV